MPTAGALSVESCFAMRAASLSIFAFFLWSTPSQFMAWTDRPYFTIFGTPI